MYWIKIEMLWVNDFGKYIWLKKANMSRKELECAYSGFLTFN